MDSMEKQRPPKLKTIPTPAQARILKALCEYEGLRITWYEKQAGYFAGRGSILTKREVGNPRNKTLRTMRDQLWIEQDEGWRGSWLITDLGVDAMSSIDDEYLYPVPKGMTAQDVLQVLRKLHNSLHWAWAEELWMPGWNRRIDAFTIRMVAGEYDSPYLQKIAYEIKIDRSDFRKDVADPTKRMPAMEYANRFYYVAPFGVIPLAEIPEDCGLMEIREDRQIKITRKASDLHATSPTWDLLAAFTRAVSKGKYS